MANHEGKRSFSELLDALAEAFADLVVAAGVAVASLFDDDGED